MRVLVTGAAGFKGAVVNVLVCFQGELPGPSQFPSHRSDAGVATYGAGEDALRELDRASFLGRTCRQRMPYLAGRQRAPVNAPTSDFLAKVMGKGCLVDVKSRLDAAIRERAGALAFVDFSPQEASP